MKPGRVRDDGPLAARGRPGPPWAGPWRGDWPGPPWAGPRRGDWPSPPAGWLVLPVLGVQLFGSYGAAQGQEDHRSIDLLALLLLTLGPVALAWRRRYPGGVLVVVFAVTALYLGLDYPYGPVLLSLVIALFSAVAQGRRLIGAVVAVLAGLFAFLLDPLLHDESGMDSGGAFGFVAWTVAIFVAAEFARAQRGRFREMARTREQVVARIASDERLRIARELHDVLAHNISLINVQAGVALHLMDEQPEQVRAALTTIKAASKETLTEMRSVLGVLRDVEDVAPRAPTSGLARLPELVEGMAGAGMVVTVTTHGEPRLLPAGVDLAAYRIVQESLTNVARHAGPVPVAVGITYGEQQVEVVVTDEGAAGSQVEPPPRDGSGSGNGIPGMRERAQALGGTLEAGPVPGCGFRVRATLPLRPAGVG